MKVRDLMFALLEYDMDDDIVIEHLDQILDIDVVYKYHDKVLICTDGEKWKLVEIANIIQM